jgi:predicted dehydrogenase
MPRLGAILVGLGPGSEPHLASLSELESQIDLRWAVCRHPEKAKLGPMTGKVRVLSDLSAALADPAVEMAIVATPPNTHAQIARQCLDSGKHTLVEKPLEVSLEKAEELVVYAARSGLRFGVVLQHRFRPGAVKLQQLVADGALGDIQAGLVRVPWWRPQAYYDEVGRGTLARDGGGVLLTQAIHAIDLFRVLAGPCAVTASRVSTTALHAMETEDHAAALLTLGNGAPGILTATTAMYPGFSEVIELIGTRGTAALDGGALKVRFLTGEEIEVESDGRSGGGASIMDFPNAAHRALLEDFVSAIKEGRAPAVTGEDALATHRLINAVVMQGTPSAHRR